MRRINPNPPVIPIGGGAGGGGGAISGDIPNVSSVDELDNHTEDIISVDNGDNTSSIYVRQPDGTYKKPESSGDTHEFNDITTEELDLIWGQ